MHQGLDREQSHVAAAPSRWGWPRTLGVGVVIFLVGWASFALPRGPREFTPVGLVSAVLLAILLLAPRRAWPGLALAALVGRSLAALAVGVPPVVALPLSLCHVAQALLAAALVLRMLRRAPDFADLDHIGRYLAAIAIAALAGGLAAGAVDRVLLDAAFWPNALHWAARDFTGMATLAPCLLVLADRRGEWRSLVRPGAWPLAVLLALEVTVLFFATAPLLYLVVVALLLVAWRLGPLGAAAGVVSALVLSVAGVVVHRGPLSAFPGSAAEKLLLLQLFLTVSFHVSVPVAARLARAGQLQTALGKALEATRDSEARFRLLTESMSDIVLQFDTQHRLRYVSPSCRVLGYTPAEVLSRRIEDFAHPDDLPKVQANIAALMNGDFDPATDRRYRIRKKDGSYRWYEGAPGPLRDASGAIVGVVNLLRDVHDQHAGAEALAASEERYRVLADQMNDMVGCYGRDGKLTFVTGASRQLLGYDPDELVGRNVADLMPPEDAQAARLALREHLERGGTASFRIECRMIRRDGSMVWVEGNPRAIRDETGQVVAWQDVVRDISGHKALEAKLRAARAEADFAATANAEFLIDMSHEFRGPLNSVLGFARLSHARPGLRDPIRTYIERMEEACRGLLGLVNDVLDFSRLEAKQVAFRPRPTPIGAFTAAALAQMEPQARAKRLELRLADRTPPDLVVSIDQDRLRQVLLNLLGNAVKFTHAGTVSLEVAYDPAERLHVTVRDTGPGIPNARLDRLFERFSQVDEAGDRLYRGAGLGLAISKGIIDGMGGEISVASEAGRGSTFSFWTPAPRVAGTARTDPADVDAAPRIRLLIAAADPDARAWLIDGLAALKADLLVVADGQAALKLARAEAVDAILLDLELPKVTSATVVRRLRARNGPNVATPVLGLAPMASEGLYGAVIEKGFQGLVDRTLSPPELTSAVVHAVAVANDTMTPPRPARAAPSRRKRQTAPG